MDAVIGESRNEPVGVERDRGDDAAVRVEHGDPVRAQAPPTALPIDDYQGALVMNYVQGQQEAYGCTRRI